MRQRGSGRTDLNHESIVGKGIVPHDDATNVAQNLADAAEEHTRQEAPAAPADAEKGVTSANQGKEDEEDDVGGQRRAVAKHAPFDGAVVEAARRVGAKDVVGAVREISHVAGHFVLRRLVLLVMR